MIQSHCGQWAFPEEMICFRVRLDLSSAYPLMRRTECDYPWCDLCACKLPAWMRTRARTSYQYDRGGLCVDVAPINTCELPRLRGLVFSV